MIFQYRAFLLTVLLMFSGHALAAESQNSSLIKETESSSGFKGTMYQVWGRLRALSPKTNIEDGARSRVVVTAGIRGSESTDTALKPYWKDDRTNDEKYLKQLESYNVAQELIEKGQMKEAAASLGKFIDQYPDSELLPNAVFAEAMALAGMGEKDGSIKQFRKFIKENPSHPLRADAEMAVQELGGK